MSTTSGDAQPAGVDRERRRVQPTQILWLSAAWVLLWGDLSVANVLSGALLGVLVAVVFPMPAVQMRLRIRPLRLAWLVVRFLADVVVASVQVAALTMRFGHTPRNAIVEVPLRTPSDFVLTVVSEMTSLVPGSIVVETRRRTHTIYLHTLDARDESGVEEARRGVYETERRVVLALGADTSLVDRPAPERSER